MRRSRIPVRSMLSRIRLLVFDVDGVLTDGTIRIDAGGDESKTFDVRDGFAIARAVEHGIFVAFVSGRLSKAVTIRAKELKVTCCVQECKDKQLELQRLKEKLKLSKYEVAFVGDDLNDLAGFAECGVRIAVADAASELRNRADWTTRQRGGHGAAREVIEAVMRSKGLWRAVVNFYAVKPTRRVLDPALNDK